MYYSLGVAPSSARCLARTARVNSRTADRLLPRLASFGLAKRTGQGWVIGPATPDDVVADMGWVESNSRVGQRKAHIDAERDWYRWYHPAAG